MTAAALINKQRPSTWGEIIGQGEIVRSLQKVIKDNSSRAFLFIGPSGVGKTTIARIAAHEVGCAVPLEIDGATFTSIENMRVLTEGLKYRPLDTQNRKAIIIDECHAISRAGIQSLLKSLEEPPSWCRWFLCTTEGTKILDTIKRRCTTYNLKLVPTSTIFDFLCKIAEKENLEVSEQVIDLCAKEAEGSPGKALAHLNACSSAGDRAEAALLLRSALDTPQAIALAQGLAKGFSWDQAKPLLSALEDQNPESIRLMICSYFSKVALSSKAESTALQQACAVLDAFSQPMNSQDKLAPIILAVAKLIT